MAEDAEKDPAYQRVISERDQARKDLDAAKSAAAEALGKIKLAEVFSGMGVKDPFAVASRAAADLGDVTGFEPDALKAKATEWRDEQASLAQMLNPEQNPQAPSTPMSTVNPSLTAPGLPAKTDKVVVGSTEFYEQGWHNRSTQEQVEAMRRGDLVSSDKVRNQQQDIIPGFAPVKS